MMASGDIRCDIVGICSYEIITGWDIYIGGVLFYTFLQCVSVIQSWSILTSI